MSLEAYSPCPCGSGKKLKFCCQAIVGDIEKIEALIEGNQRLRAVQALESLERKHPGHPWVVTTRAEILIQEGAPDQAAELLEPFVESQGDHHYALALLAIASFRAAGFELAKPIVHRAFQRCVRDFPDMLADLAMGIASSMLGTGRYLSARAHLVLALRLAAEEMKSQIFMRLMEFDSNSRIPYPLRSVHELSSVAGADQKGSDAHKAMLLSQLGCWRPAARLFTKLAEADPENAALWSNAGLCRAWDGDQKLASEALHKAAQLKTDVESAVEWETIAQLLDYNITEDRIQILSQRYAIESVSKLLSCLDDDERLTRVAMPGMSEEGPAAMYYIVDDPQRLQLPAKDVTPDTVANVDAQVTVFEGEAADPAGEEDENTPPRVYVTGSEGSGFEAAAGIFEDAARASELSLQRDDDEEDDAFTPSLPRDLAPLLWRWHFPENTPQRRQRAVEREMWQRVTSHILPDQPLAVLEGKTQREAAGEDRHRVALRASINVIDAYCDRDNFSLDVDALAGTLGIDPPPEFEFNGQSLNSVTSLELRRINPSRLDDEQLATLLQRAVLIHHGRLLYDVLSLAVERPPVMERFDRQRLLLSFSDLCRDSGRYDEAFRWIQQGREHAGTLENSFESTLQWVMRELQLRLEDPGDPEITPLVQHIGDYYIPKLPELRAPVTQLVASAGITPPWEDDAIGAAAGGSLWTPGAEEPKAAGGEKKLWLPGQ